VAGYRRGGPPTVDDVAALVARRVPGRVAVSDPTWLATFRTHRRSAPGYRAGRILLAGDAVHIHSPAGGQGMNTGLLDAHNLAWKLAAVAAGQARDDLIDTYGAERGPVAGDVLALSHRLVRLSSLSAPWQRAVFGPSHP
jgi:2-polyprenyl-6-methoxyphenol hydroxylase-like FAD-dependent oxidoreductase